MKTYYISTMTTREKRDFCAEIRYILCVYVIDTLTLFDYIVFDRDFDFIISFEWPLNIINTYIDIDIRKCHVLHQKDLWN